MKILSLDASGRSVSAALLDGDKVLAEAFEDMGLKHSVRLLPMIDGLMNPAGWHVRDLDMIAAVVGPGSFTGVRISVSTARGLAQPYDTPCVGINTLEALAFDAPPFDGIVCPMLDARADQVYAGAFDARDMSRRFPDGAFSLAEFLEKVKAKAHETVKETANELGDTGAFLFTGDASLIHRAAIMDIMGGSYNVKFAAPLRILPRASAAGMLALAGHTHPVKYTELLPIYLRKPQAERNAE